MNRRRRRSAGVLASIAAACTLASGCVTIPGDGPVVPGNRVQGVAGVAVGILPNGPPPGASPSELVRNFIYASETFANDGEVAREYLHQSATALWQPEGRVVVYPSVTDLAITSSLPGEPSATSPSATSPSATSPSAGAPTAARTTTARTTTARTTTARTTTSTTRTTTSTTTPPPQPGRTATVTVTVPVVARLDTGGIYTVSRPGDTETRSFGLVATADGWRISTLDNGILINQTDFGITFRDLPVYFADPQGRYLVPDVRWFPVNGTATSSALVSTLLGGPSPWLSPGVVTGAPAGTLPTVNGVKVVGGVATVDLTRAVRAADARQRLLLQAQLDRTLAGVQQIDSVAVTVEQQAFEMQATVSAPPPDAVEATPPSGPAMPPSVEDRLIGLDAKGTVVQRDGIRTVPVRGLAGLTSAGNVAPAVQPGGAAYAVLQDGRTRLVHGVPDGAVTTLARGTGLVAPSFDVLGWVWSAQDAPTGTVLAARPGADVVRLHAGWLDGAHVRSLRISREGARAVLVVQQGTKPAEVLVCAVIRAADGRPQGLGPPLRLIADAQDVSGAAWVDSTRVVVLARRPRYATMPWIVELGGGATPTAPVEGTAVTAGNGEWDLFVTAAGGTARYRAGSGWSDVAGIRWPAKPG